MTFDWDTITKEVASGIALLIPVGETLAPEAAPVLAIIGKIVAGAADAEPVAVALLQQIQSGVVPTQTQLATFYASYQSDDDALKADIDQHLAALSGT